MNQTYFSKNVNLSPLLGASSIRPIKNNFVLMKTLFKCVFIAIIVISCEKSDSGNNSDSSNSGKGGSMARFTISGNYLYTVDQQNLKVYQLTDPNKPVFVKNLQAGFNIETIFANKNTLFLGSEWGMYIFDITEPANPTILSNYQHIYSCDPVVANDSIAYVTLRTETWCGRSTNEMQVVNIKNKKKPVFISSVNMIKPMGLGIDGNQLFVCDNGLKVFSLNDPYHPALLKRFDIPAVDVIPDENLLMVLASDGLHQYKYENDTITYLSHLK